MSNHQQQEPIERRLSLGLATLKKLGYFKRSPFRGVLRWPVATPSAPAPAVNLLLQLDEAAAPPTGTLTIAYNQHGRYHEEVIRLIRRKSNLGLPGGIWYFVCPQTGRYCRTLYDGPGGFASRHAEGGLRYRAQLESRKWRTLGLPL